ncbi:MAG: ATP-binding cassette domain-containing protein, partial [Spirochaetaceae bacterium]|nr:ATP-binding cassette domain-containing protein [Spirochaetaceae bacterium]
MLHFKNVSKAYGHVVALKDASLRVGKGELRGLLGGNGSGKSTLVKIAGGVVMPDSGKIFIRDQEVKINSPKDAGRNSVVTTFQELSILPNLPVWENMLLGAMPVHAGICTDKKEARRRCLEMLKELNLEHRIDTDVQSLPKNEQYMLELGKALMREPD